MAPRKGCLIFLYEGDSLWRWVDLSRFCRMEQEVESYNKTRRERDFEIGGRT